MSRMAKLAVVCILGGLLLAVALVSAMRPLPGPMIDPQMIEVDKAPLAKSDEPKRCRTISEPDAACDALWEAQRRRFFHGED